MRRYDEERLPGQSAYLYAIVLVIIVALYLVAEAVAALLGE